MHPDQYWKANYSVTLIAKDYYKRFGIGQRKELSMLDELSIKRLLQKIRYGQRKELSMLDALSIKRLLQKIRYWSKKRT